MLFPIFLFVLPAISNIVHCASTFDVNNVRVKRQDAILGAASLAMDAFGQVVDTIQEGFAIRRSQNTEMGVGDAQFKDDRRFETGYGRAVGGDNNQDYYSSEEDLRRRRREIDDEFLEESKENELTLQKLFRACVERIRKLLNWTSRGDDGSNMDEVIT